MKIDKSVIEELEDIMSAFDITAELNSLAAEQFQLLNPSAEEAAAVYKRAAVLVLAVQDRMEDINAALGRLIDRIYLTMRGGRTDCK